MRQRHRGKNEFLNVVTERAYYQLARSTASSSRRIKDARESPTAHFAFFTTVWLWENKMKTTKSAWCTVGILIAMIVGAMSPCASGATSKIVTPPLLATVEGNSFATPEAVPRRIQFLIPASDFAGLSESHGRLVSFNFRADTGLTQPFDWSSSDSQIWMSTTSKSALTLTNTFDNNHGADKALVHDGQISFPLLGTGPPQGPRDIADGPELQMPFNYDPSAGNLLIEWIRFDNGTSGPRLDVLQPPTGPGATVLLNQNSATATTGSLLNLPPVIQFEFAAVPEPSTLVLAGATCLCLFAWRRGRVA
jgi:hypothetical protein